MSASAKETVTQRLAALRAAMRRHGVDAFLVPTADPHQSEYVPPCWRRREWLTGFSGSQGIAVVAAERAWLVADSRYWLQAERELAGTGIELVRQGAQGVPQVPEWLAQAVGEGRALGVDPQTISLEDERKYRKALEGAGARLVLTDRNLVDETWPARPPLPLAPLRPLTATFSGEAPASKLARVRAELTKARCDALVVTTLDAIAWLFDVRGSDVEFNPVATAYALVDTKGATLFVAADKLTDAVRRHLPAEVTVRDYDAFEGAVRALATESARAWVEPGSCSAWVGALLAGGAKLHEARSPITSFKARKNAVELAGARRCHVRDGAAVVRFLAWLEDAVARGPVTELEAAARLAAFRAENEHFQGLSFETISAFGDHGAIVHYRPAEEGDRVIDGSSLYLVDSGAQYLDGTTDITRTVCLGTPTAEQREQFTRVLQGHVSLARAIFPAGTSGKQLDVLARRALWDVGLDYGHGTGHGVGAYLNVHEGPQRIATRGEDVALEPGMICSNEPGYYVTGSHGIRIESLIVVVERKDLSREGSAFLAFETITACPIDRKLVDPARLLPDERRWLDEHHRWVRATLSPLLEASERAWLDRATAPL